MIKKFFSRKLITIVATATVDVLITVGVLPAEGRESFVLLFNGLTGIYVTVQGIIDMITAHKGA